MFGLYCRVIRIAGTMNPVRCSAWLLTIALVLPSGFAFAGGLPAIADKPGVQHPGTFVWFDLITPDRDWVRAYYAGLFGWDISEAEGFDGYDMITNQGVKIGGIAEIPEEDQPVWLGSLSTSDLDRTTVDVAVLGGRIVDPIQRVNDRGVMAVLEDPSGAPFVLLDTGARDPELGPIRVGDWLWADLYVGHMEAPARFYEGLLGMRLTTVEEDDGSEVNVFITGDTARAGMVKNPFEHVDPIWLPYVRVADIEQILERSEQLGGELFFRLGDTAILLDPAGAAFGVQQVTERMDQ